jgi:flagellin-specific chaperone FliS
MEGLFFPRKQPALPSKEAAEANILAQRFEGKSSIDAISTLMKRAFLPFSSVGYISQYLSRVGELLPNVLANTCEPEQFLAFADDEIFAKLAPILITVDPISSAILRIELVDRRSADEWSHHYQALLENGFSPDLLTSDAGTALCAAHEKIFPDTPWQSDTFHGIAHRLGGWVRRLEKSAYTAIEEADKHEKTLVSAKTEPVVDKRLNRCFTADDAAKQAIELYDNFSYLYQYIIRQLNVFDSKGNLRQYDEVKEKMEIALELMETLNHNPINKAIASIKKALPDLLTYRADASVAVANCQKLNTDQDTLQALFLAWQWNKVVIKAKPVLRKHKAIEQCQFYLELAELLIDCKEKYLALKDSIFEELDQIIQASSMVECINSILRPYLNTSKNQITQAFLNTFMFYHNHRRYHAGKRKGKTPMEILTGKDQQEDWIVLLQEEALTVSA